MTKEVMKQALDALNESGLRWPNIVEAIKALEEALKQEKEYEVVDGVGRGVEIPAGWKYYYIKPKLSLQQKQEQDEPVGKFAKFTDGIWREVTDGSAGVPLYTTPQTKEWVGLNGADWNDFNPLKSNDPHRVAEWVEKLLKERNT